MTYTTPTTTPLVGRGIPHQIRTGQPVDEEDKSEEHGELTDGDHNPPAPSNYETHFDEFDNSPPAARIIAEQLETHITGPHGRGGIQEGGARAHTRELSRQRAMIVH